MGHSLWYVKIDPHQSQDLSTLVEKVLFLAIEYKNYFEIRHSKLKLWAVKVKASKQQIPVQQVF